jgi:hypothetical protein
MAMTIMGLAVSGCTPVDTALPPQKPGAAEAAGNGSCLEPTVRQVEETRGTPTLLSVVGSTPADAQTQAGYTTAFKIFDGPHIAASVDWKSHGNWANQEEVRQSLADKVHYPLTGPLDLATDLMTTMSSIDVKATLFGYAEATPTDISFSVRCANRTIEYPGIVHTWINTGFGVVECGADIMAPKNPTMAREVKAKYCVPPSPTRSQ